jgi:hypothetical protein
MEQPTAPQQPKGCGGRIGVFEKGDRDKDSLFAGQSIGDFALGVNGKACHDVGAFPFWPTCLSAAGERGSRGIEGRGPFVKSGVVGPGICRARIGPYSGREPGCTSGGNGRGQG